MSANLFRSWIKKLGGRAPRLIHRRSSETSNRAERGKARLALESLETRIVPASFTVSSANLPVNATAVVIQGTGIDPNPAMDVVNFANGSVSGTVYAATNTSLTVSLTNLSSVSTGQALEVYGQIDGSYTNPFYTDVAVVAAAGPWIAPSNTPLPVNATSITIAGSDFDPTAANDNVSFDHNVTGSVTSASTSALTVAVTGLSSLCNRHGLECQRHG